MTQKTTQPLSSELRDRVEAHKQRMTEKEKEWLKQYCQTRTQDSSHNKTTIMEGLELHLQAFVDDWNNWNPPEINHSLETIVRHHLRYEKMINENEEIEPMHVKPR